MKYTVYLETVASTGVEVEADSKEEAYEKAVESDMPQICAQCSGWGKQEWLELGDEWELPMVPRIHASITFEEALDRYVIKEGE